MEDEYRIPFLARFLHSLPHLNISLHQVNSTFNPKSPLYIESLGILGSVPVVWLILTLFVLLIYLLTRCCDRRPRPARSIAALKVSLAIVSIFCSCAIGLGLYGNDDLHNGVIQIVQQGKQIDSILTKISNQSYTIQHQLIKRTGANLEQLRDIFYGTTRNMSLYKTTVGQLDNTVTSNTMAASAITDIGQTLINLGLIDHLDRIQEWEELRWPFTMGVLSVLLVLCVILLVGVARHSRCALIAFSVCGLLAIIISYTMSSLYITSSVGLGDFCVAPDKYFESRTGNPLSREILRYYTHCERARPNPFAQRLREVSTNLMSVRSNLTIIRPAALDLYKNEKLPTIFTQLDEELNLVGTQLTSLTAAVDCRILHSHYIKGVRALCNVGLLGLGMMLLSALLSGLLLTALVWVDSHAWIYIRKKKEYHEVVSAHDPYLTSPRTSQTIVARTLQRSQGLSNPPDTPPPSYTSALHMHNQPTHASAPNPSHAEARFLLDGCDMLPPNDHPYHHHHHPHRSNQMRGHTLGRLPSHHHHHYHHESGPNNGKYATLSKQCKTLESSDFY